MSPRVIAKALAGSGAVALLVLLAVTTWVVRHRSDTQANRKSAGVVPGALLHAHNFHWTQMKAGARQWVLDASDATYANDRSSLTLTDAALSMVSDDGRPVVINAPHAVLVVKGNHVLRADMSGGTIVHYGEFLFTTDAASYVPDEDRLDAPGMVTVEGEGMKVTGVGLTGNSKTRVFELRSQVSTHIVPKHEVDNAKAG